MNKKKWTIEDIVEQVGCTPESVKNLLNRKKKQHKDSVIVEPDGGGRGPKNKTFVYKEKAYAIIKYLSSKKETERLRQRLKDL